MEYIELLINAAQALRAARDHTDSDELKNLSENLESIVHAEVNEAFDEWSN